MGWSVCATIGSNSGFDQSATQAFNAEAVAAGVSVLTNQMMITGQCSPGSLDKQMAALKATRTRIFGLFAIIGDARCILSAAVRAGLAGPGYAWFGTYTIMDETVWQDAAGNDIPEYTTAFRDVIGVRPLYVESPAEIAFINAYQVLFFFLSIYIQR